MKIGPVGCWVFSVRTDRHDETISCLSKFFKRA